MLSNGVKLPAQVQKFSPPPSVDSTGKPTPDSGRDLALLRVQDGVYPAIGLTTREVQIGDPVHILGFPGVVLSHELLNQNVTLEASATNGAVSGFKMDVINQDLIQTDAPAAHGNSGGPAVTDDATLVGVMQFVSLSASGANVQGFNFPDPRARRRQVPAGHRGQEARREQVQSHLGRGHRAVVRPALQGGGREDLRGQRARAEPDRREALARAGAGEGEESAARAVPVGAGDARRDRPERRRVRRHVGQALVEEPLPVSRRRRSSASSSAASTRSCSTCAPRPTSRRAR